MTNLQRTTVITPGMAVRVAAKFGSEEEAAVQLGVPLEVIQGHVKEAARAFSGDINGDRVTIALCKGQHIVYAGRTPVACGTLAEAIVRAWGVLEAARFSLTWPEGAKDHRSVWCQPPGL